MRPVDICYTVIEVLIGVVSVVGNGLVLFVIYKDKRLQVITNYFIASLASADFLVGLIGTPCVVVNWFQMPYNFYGCLIMTSTIVVLTQISIFALLMVAIERFVAIRSPFRYHDCFTGKVAAIIIAISWVAAIIIGFVPVFGWNLGPTSDNACAFVKVIDMKYMVYFNFFFCVLTPLIIIFIIYAYIFHVVQKQKRRIETLQITTESNKSSRHAFLKELKAAKWFALVIAFFVLCWLPLHIMNSITLFANKTNFYALLVAIFLSHVNSALNPFLYAYGNRKFKNALKKVFGLPVLDGFDTSTHLGATSHYSETDKRPLELNTTNLA